MAFARSSSASLCGLCASALNHYFPICTLLLLASGGLRCLGAELANSVSDATKTVSPSSFNGSKPGDQRDVAGLKLCWCPPGKFIMGSPRKEPERRPGEDQVQVTLTKSFWLAKYEATQGEWKRVMGPLPGP